MAEAQAQPAAAAPVAPRRDPGAAGGSPVPGAPGRSGPRHRAGHGHVGQHGRHGRDARSPDRGQERRDRGAARPADRRQGQRHRCRSQRSDRRQRIERPGPGAAGHRGHPGDPEQRRPGRRPRARLEARCPIRRCPGPGRDGRGPRQRPDGSSDRPGQGPAGRPGAQEPGHRRARREDVTLGGHPVGVHQRRQRRPGAGRPPGRAVGRRSAAGGPRRRHRGAGARGRHRGRPAARRAHRRGPPRQCRPGRDHPLRPSRSRRSRLGRHPARPHPVDPGRRRRRSLSRDGPRLSARRRAVRREAGRVRSCLPTAGRPTVGPHHLRGLPAGDPAALADPGHRATTDEPARRGRRQAHEPRDRHPGTGRTGPPLRRPVDDAHRRGDPAHDPGVGPDHHPRAARRATAVRRSARRDRHRGAGVRAATIRPAAPGRLPDPARQPDRRAARFLDRTHRGRPARHAGRARRSRPARRA